MVYRPGSKRAARYVAFFAQPWLIRGFIGVKSFQCFQCSLREEILVVVGEQIVCRGMIVVTSGCILYEDEEGLQWMLNPIIYEYFS